MQYIVVTLALHREGRAWVSECVELGTVSCGSTEQEALENIKDATTLYLNGLEDLGECEQVLREKGITIHPMRPAAEPAVAKPIQPRRQTAISSAVFHIGCGMSA